MLRKVIVTSGKYVDYLNEIQTSHKLGFPAYRIAHQNLPYERGSFAWVKW